MAHRAKLYQLEVHTFKKPDDRRLLGNVDGMNTSTKSILEGHFSELNAHNRDATIHISLDQIVPNLDSQYFGASLLRGGTGIRSDIGRNGQTMFQRQVDDTESVRVGVLFYLPRSEYRGLVALHVPHRLGYKSVLERELHRHFRSRDLSLNLTPIVPTEVYEQAVMAGRVKKLTLLLHSGSDLHMASKFGRVGGPDQRQVALSFDAARSGYLNVSSLRRFFEDRTDENLRQLLEVEEIQFDEASVQVELLDGVRRSFNVEYVEGGHPLSVDLRLGDEDTLEHDIGPAVDELMEELTRVIKMVD